MALPRILRRLLGGTSPEAAERDRYTAADDLERKTQSHYRSVTGVDNQGRPADRDKEAPPNSR